MCAKYSMVKKEWNAAKRFRKDFQKEQFTFTNVARIAATKWSVGLKRDA